MNVAIMTDTAIIHGFPEGLHSAGRGRASCGVLLKVPIQFPIEIAPCAEFTAKGAQDGVADAAVNGGPQPR